MYHKRAIEPDPMVHLWEIVHRFDHFSSLKDQQKRSAKLMLYKESLVFQVLPDNNWFSGPAKATSASAGMEPSLFSLFD